MPAARALVVLVCSSLTLNRIHSNESDNCIVDTSVEFTAIAVQMQKRCCVIDMVYHKCAVLSFVQIRLVLFPFFAIVI